MQLEQPPPPPGVAPKIAGLALPAVIAGLVAIVLALPILWWRISAQPVDTSLAADVLREVIQGNSTAWPDWYAGVRASAMIAAFLALLLAVIALILKHSGRLAGIAMVLALAAFAATSSGLGLLIAGGIVLLGVLWLTLGIG